MTRLVAKAVYGAEGRPANRHVDSVQAFPNRRCSTVQPPIRSHMGVLKRVEVCDGGLCQIGFKKHHFDTRQTFCQKARCCTSWPDSPATFFLNLPILISEAARLLQNARESAPHTTHDSTTPASVSAPGRLAHPSTTFPKLASNPPPPSDKTPPYAADSSRARPHLLGIRCTLLPVRLSHVSRLSASCMLIWPPCSISRAPLFACLSPDAAPSTAFAERGPGTRQRP